VPQTFVVPPPPHVWGVEHAPQFGSTRGMPQLSLPATGPQFFPRRAQNSVCDSGRHPQTFAVVLPQSSVAAQVPQLEMMRRVPQLSLAM
jgi:hypothetical protein